MNSFQKVQPRRTTAESPAQNQSRTTRPKRFFALVWFIGVTILAVTLCNMAYAGQAAGVDVEDSTAADVTPEERDTADPSGADEAEQKGGMEERPTGFWRNLVPVPIFITEPAIGEGLGVAVGYFHPTADEGSNSETPVAVDGGSVNDVLEDRSAPPTITGFAAGYTTNETKFFGVGHSRTLNRDHVRLNVGAGWADVFADIYLLGIPFEFNLEGYLLYADTRVRIGDSDLFWGIGGSALKADNTFLLPLPEQPPLGLLAFDFLDVGLTGRLMFDTRNDSLFPASGQRVDLTVAVHDSSIGGDYDYVHSKFKALAYHPLGRRTVISGRIEAQHISGDPPFFAVPYVSLRGIPALRYQGERVAVGEAEVRYRFASRWTALAFAGLGWRETGRFQEDDSIYNYGVGGRFKVHRNREVWMGLDIARGPEDTHWYVKVGQAW